MNEASMAADREAIIAHQADNGSELWTTVDKKLLKGAPFTALESPLYLLELGESPESELLKASAELIFSAWKSDGRFKLAPTGGIYPCHTALAFKTLSYLGHTDDSRLAKTLTYFIETQEQDGGWKCLKYSFGRGEETNYSTPNTTLIVLDALRFYEFPEKAAVAQAAIEFLLQHWVIRKPIGPCHYGIGTLFMQVEYPFRGYNLFYYVYVLSFYSYAQKDSRFLAAFQALEEQTVGQELIVQRVVPKLAKLDFCKKGQPSILATQRFNEIKANLRQG